MKLPLLLLLLLLPGAQGDGVGQGGQSLAHVYEQRLQSAAERKRDRAARAL